jgi:hypothetical protein
MFHLESSLLDVHMNWVCVWYHLSGKLKNATQTNLTSVQINPFFRNEQKKASRENARLNQN